jgi:2',3'-cyclic-nucleotide 2'-phosphodiesterase (5'-nucleotidase family)
MTPARDRPRCLVFAGLALALLAGCGAHHAALTPSRIDVAKTRIDAQLADAPDVAATIAPFRAVMQASMQESLAVLPEPMDTGKPEGPLGALIADITLDRAREASGLPVDAAVINDGGLRIPWPAGVITLDLVFQVMPFDNEIVVVRLSAEKMRMLADQIAERHGEPVSGMSFRIADEQAVDLLVGGRPVEERDYWVATSDYLAGGGGGMDALWNAVETRHTGVLMRDAIADALRRITKAKRGADRLGTVPMPAMGRVR